MFQFLYLSVYKKIDKTIKFLKLIFIIELSFDILISFGTPKNIKMREKLRTIGWD